MAQLFKPVANTLATASLIAGAGVPFLLLGASQITRSPAGTKQFNPIDQPVPFSHKHHTKELGIDCRYCHYTVEYSAKASVPATEVCMSCHSQIWTNSPMLAPVRDSYESNKPLRWAKVNNVPDFVYFDHSIHINRGISCNTCHGAVQEMPITWKGQAFRMAWCLDCHKNPGKYMLLDEEGAEHSDGHEGDGHEGDGHSHEGEHDSVSTLSPRERVFAIYHKIAAGEKLTDVERKTAIGKTQQLPADDVHAGYKVMQQQDINITQLQDCYICHR